MSEARLVAAERHQQHVEIILYRVTFGWDTVLQFDPIQKNLSIKTLMLTDLMVESAIWDSGEKRYSLEMSRNRRFAWKTMQISFVFNIQQVKYLNAKIFIIV